MTGAWAAAQAIAAAGRREPSVISLQELHRGAVAPPPSAPTTPVA
jgi:hypothetical protein